MMLPAYKRMRRPSAAWSIWSSDCERLSTWEPSGRANIRLSGPSARTDSVFLIGSPDGLAEGRLPAVLHKALVRTTMKSNEATAGRATAIDKRERGFQP